MKFLGNLPADLRPMRFFLLVGPILYVAYALFTPPFQTPDEHQHLFRAYQLASFQLIGEKRGKESGGELPLSLSRAALPELGSTVPHALQRPLPKTSIMERFSRSTPLNSNGEKGFTNFLGSVTYSPVGYIPQIAAVWIGRGLNFSVEMILRLGRLLNAALTVALFYGAFRALPVGRLALLFIALLPMTAACAGSFGQDGLIISGCAWLTALSARTAIGCYWRSKEVTTTALLTFAVTVAKMVYLPLVGLALFSVGDVKNWRPKALPVIIGVLAVIILALWIRLNAGVYVPMMPGRPSLGLHIEYLVHHPMVFPKAVALTYYWQTGTFLRQIFTFGWLNVGPVPLAMSTSISALLLLIWYGDTSIIQLSRSWRYGAVTVVALVIILLSLALYIGAAPLGSAQIIGLQGRYFIPLVLPVLLVIIPVGRKRAIDGCAIVTLLLIVGNLAALAAIRQAYYL